MARPTLYGPPFRRVNGWITEEAAKVFDEVKRLLMLREDKTNASDGNVVECALRNLDVKQLTHDIRTGKSK